MPKSQELDMKALTLGRADFKFLIKKADLSEKSDPIENWPDGNFFIEGVASSPSVDADGEAFSMDAIKSMMDQINKGGIPLRDAHEQEWDADLGTVVRGWIEGQDLHIFCQLDTDNPSALHLYKSLAKGKQLGLSVAGLVRSFVMDISESLGKTVKTFTEIILTEISVTSSPANYDTWVVNKGGWMGTIVKTTNKLNQELMNVKKSEEVVAAPAVETPAAPAAAPVETPTAEAPKPAEAPVEAPKVEEKPAPAPAAEPAAPAAETPAATEEVAKAMKAVEDSMGALAIAKSALEKVSGAPTATAPAAKPVEKSQEPQVISDAVIMKHTQQIFEAYRKSGAKIVGGMRRIEEQVRALAKAAELQANEGAVRKGVATAQVAEVEKNKPTAQPTVVKSEGKAESFAEAWTNTFHPTEA